MRVGGGGLIDSQAHLDEAVLVCESPSQSVHLGAKLPPNEADIKVDIEVDIFFDKNLEISEKDRTIPMNMNTL